MKRRQLPFWLQWRMVALASLAATAVLALLLYRLGSLAPRLSPVESASLAASAHWHLLMDNPQHLPFKLLARLAAYVPAGFGHTLLIARLPSVLFGALSACLVLYILRRWYGHRTMVFGFVLFISAAWFLHVGRFAGFEVEYLAAVVSLIAAYVALYGNDENMLVAYLWFITNAACLFVPGLAWFVVAGALLQLPELANAWRYAAWWMRGSWTVMLLIGVAGPAYSIVRSPLLWRSWLGLPAQFGSWQDMLHRLAGTGLAFVWHGPHDPQAWLGRLPLLDAFVIAMFLAGTVFYVRHWRAARTRLLLAYFVLGVLLVSAGGVVGLSVIFPVVYLIAAGGMAYVLYFWLKKFPRNIFARAFGIALIAGLLGLSCFYGLSQYFIAWPHNPETVAVYKPAAH